MSVVCRNWRNIIFACLYKRCRFNGISSLAPRFPDVVKRVLWQRTAAQRSSRRSGLIRCPKNRYHNAIYQTLSYLLMTGGGWYIAAGVDLFIQFIIYRGYLCTCLPYQDNLCHWRTKWTFTCQWIRC